MKYRLSELFDLQMGKTPDRKNQEYWETEQNQWISIADISKSNKYITKTKEYISNKAVKESNIKTIPQNTVIMSFKLSIGKVAITTKDVFSNEAIMAFINKGVVDIIPDYLYYLFLNHNWQKNTNKSAKGVTLNKKILSNIVIDIHEIEKQKEIVDVLNRVTNLILLREEQLHCYDNLVKSWFVEMFGDPGKNDKCLPTKPLSELGTLNRGISKCRPRNLPELFGGKYPFIQTGEIANSSLYINKFENTYSEKGLAQSKIWPINTLCITIAANIAKTAILTFDACFPDSVVGFISGNEVNNIYIHYWFTFFQKILEEQAPQSAQKNINLKILSELNVTLPPLELQNQFAEFVQQVDKSKSTVKRNLEDLILLRKSLMQQYFGE